MDSTKLNVGTEGCSSSESGWTTYIASPMQEDDDCSDDIDEHDHNTLNTNRIEDNGDDDVEQDSDDSMASDASSGPHQQQESQQGYGRIAASFKLGKGNNFNHRSSATKQNKNDRNSNDKNRKREKVSFMEIP